MGDDRDYLKRLEAMNRKPLRHQPDPGPEVEQMRRKLRKTAAPGGGKPPCQPILYSRDLSPVAPRTAPSRLPPGKPVLLEKAASGVEIPGPRGGRAYLIESRLQQDGKGVQFNELLRQCSRRPGSGLLRLLAARWNIQHLPLEDLILVDIETTGLGNSPLFLIGAMVWEGDGLIARQYLARDYSEEHVVTALFAECLLGKQLLVSFNGKSFDLPYIRNRAAVNAVPFRDAPAHLDLLHEARRAWRSRVPDCKLQTLERHICGRARYGDIPGSEIPEAYHAFVRTADARQLAQIIEHNRLDLVTLLDLMLRLPE